MPPGVGHSQHRNVDLRYKVSKKTRAWLLAAVVVVVAVAVYFVWAIANREDPAPTPEPTLSSTATATATPSATPTATSTGSASASPTPDAPSETSTVTPSASTSPSRATVDVAMTYYGFNAVDGAVEVGGYANVVEADGVCTLTLTKGSSTVSKQASATPDASSTSCGEMSVAQNEISSGTWTATVSYQSSTSEGVSAPATIEVP